MTFTWIVLATLATGVLSVLAAVLVTFAFARRWIPYLVSYAVGVLLAAAFLDLLPEAAESLRLATVLATTLVGILAFFLLEKLTLCHHAHRALGKNDVWRHIKPAWPIHCERRAGLP